jgi:hypothetical protein
MQCCRHLPFADYTWQTGTQNILMRVKKDISANPLARTVCKGYCRLHQAAGETENQRLHKKHPFLCGCFSLVVHCLFFWINFVELRCASVASG